MYLSYKKVTLLLSLFLFPLYNNFLFQFKVLLHKCEICESNMANSLKCKIIFNLLLCGLIHFHNRPPWWESIDRKSITLDSYSWDTTLVLTCFVARPSQACVSHKVVLVRTQSPKCGRKKQEEIWLDRNKSVSLGERGWRKDSGWKRGGGSRIMVSWCRVDKNKAKLAPEQRNLIHHIRHWDFFFF